MVANCPYLGIFVGQARAKSLHDRLRGEVLRGNELETLELALFLGVNQHCHLHTTRHFQHRTQSACVLDTIILIMRP